MKKTFISFMITLLLIFFPIFTLRSGTMLSANLKATAPQKIKIGVSLSSMMPDFNSFIKKAMEDNKKKEFTLIIRDAGSNQQKQEQDVNELIKLRVDVILIQPVDSITSKGLAEKAKKAGIAVLSLDRLIANTLLDGYITVDNYTAGILQAKFLADKMDYQGIVIILKGDPDNNTAEEITAGNKEVLKKEPRIKIAAEEWHPNWSAELAEKNMRRLLIKYPDLNGILANNSELALAAVKVLKENKMTDQIFTVGAGASKKAVEAIAAGDHDAEIDRMPYILGVAALNMALLMATNQEWVYDLRVKNGKYKIPVHVSPVLLIDKYNLINLEERWPSIKKIQEKSK